MAVLGPGDFGGPSRGFANCGCGEPSSPSITQGAQIFVPQIDACGPANGTSLPGNEPVSDADYQCSFGVQFQPVIDNARHFVHAAGLRPYKVFLVWQQRTRQRTWEQYLRCELVPVRVINAEGIELSSAIWGEDIQGGLTLEEISPTQVNEDILRGYIDGEDWAEKSTEREFFYELQLHQRCVGAPLAPRVRRFIHAGEPFFLGQRFMFRIALVEQKVSRSRGLIDQTIGTESEDTTALPFNRPTLVS